MRYECKCKCHRTCHTCGRAFRGPNDFHQNCGDTIALAPAGQIYTVADKNEPWPDDGNEHGIGWGL